MAAVINSPADVANLALKRLGYRLKVASLYDGSNASNHLLDIYGQTRDDMLRNGEWGFAQRMIVGTVLKFGPTNYFDTPWDPATMPPMRWRFEYAYPDDCLKVRSVRPQPGFLVDMTPLPQLFRVVNDNGFTPSRRVIVCNVEAAIIVYSAQVTDPAQWDVSFVDALAAGLARRVAPVLANLNLVQVEARDEAVSVAQAKLEQG